MSRILDSKTAHDRPATSPRRFYYYSTQITYAHAAPSFIMHLDNHAQRLEKHRQNRNSWKYRSACKPCTPYGRIDQCKRWKIWYFRTRESGSGQKPAAFGSVV